MAYSRFTALGILVLLLFPAIAVSSRTTPPPTTSYGIRNNMSYYKGSSKSGTIYEFTLLAPYSYVVDKPFYINYTFGILELGENVHSITNIGIYLLLMGEKYISFSIQLSQELTSPGEFSNSVEVTIDAEEACESFTVRYDLGFDEIDDEGTTTPVSSFAKIAFVIYQEIKGGTLILDEIKEQYTLSSSLALRVGINNTGNVETEYTLYVNSNTSEVSFESSQLTKTIGAGRIGYLEFVLKINMQTTRANIPVQLTWILQSENQSLDTKTTRLLLSYEPEQSNSSFLPFQTIIALLTLLGCAIFISVRRKPQLN